MITFVFSGGERWTGRILDRRLDHRFSIKCYGGARAMFERFADN